MTKQIQIQKLVNITSFIFLKGYKLVWTFLGKKRQFYQCELMRLNNFCHKYISGQTEYCFI